MPEHGEAGAMLLEFAVLLGASLALVLLFRRLGLGAVLGYLLAGALIGPQALGLVGSSEGMLEIAEIGIVLLLFLVGLELNPARLWKLRQDIFVFGGVQVVLCGIALALLVGVTTPFTWQAAVALGLPLALSSTAQVLPMLQSAGRLRTPFGERAFSILLFQDLSIVPLITIIAALSRAPGAADAPPGWLLGLYTVGAIVALVLAGRYLLTPLLRLIGGMGERELFVAAGLFTVLASAALMQQLGLSAALGAFVAGVMLADSPYRHEIESDVDPFRTILLGLFFLSVGMMLDLNAIAERPVFVIGMAAALVGIKAAIIFVIARLAKMDWREALAIGLLLSQGGEFGFVLFAQAEDALLIAPEAASLFGAIVTLSMATTPFLMALARRLRGADRIDPRDDLSPPSEAEGANAIVIGYGRFGQTVAQMLMLNRISVTLIDNKPGQIDLSSAFGIKIYYGDGSRVDLLRQAGAGEAQLICFCHDDRDFDEAAITQICEAFPDAQIMVRAYDRRQIMAIGKAPVAGTIREVHESAIRMARDAMRALEIDDDEIEVAEQKYRDRDCERLKAQSVDGDLKAKAHLIVRPGEELEPERTA